MAQAPRTTKPGTDTSIPAMSDLKPAERKEAQHEGIIEAVKEATTNLIKQDVGTTGDPVAAPRFQPPYEVSRLEFIVDLPEVELKKALDPKSATLTDQQVAGLLEVERSGKNRTNIVTLFMNRLDVGNVGEATAAGPTFTNDVTATTAL